MARTPIHSGEILADELEELGLTAKNVADLLEVPPNRLYQLLAGKRNVTSDTALRLGQYFGMSADFWMNLQSTYELDLARQQGGKAFSKTSPAPAQPHKNALIPSTIPNPTSPDTSFIAVHVFSVCGTVSPKY